MFRTFKFLYHLQATPRKIVSKTSIIEISSQNFLVKHYKKDHTQSKYVLLLFSGFSVDGYKDKRIRNLGKALAAIGFNVYLVALSDIEQLKISTNTIQEIQACIQHFALKKEYGANGKIALLAPSYSAGMSLIAASNSITSSCISAICAIGTFASLQSSLTHVMEAQNVDDYGRNILLKNVLPATTIPNKLSLLELLEVAIADNGYKRQQPELPEKLLAVDQETSSLWEKINTHPEFRLSLLSESFKNSKEFSNWKDELNVLKYTKHCTCPIFLLHGAGDKVIAPEESIRIHEERLRNELPSRLHLSTLIDHGDTSFSLKNWKAILALNHFFSQFINTALEKKPIIQRLINL